MKSTAFTKGNAVRDMKRGWFIGQFVPADRGLRYRRDVEIKWGIHPSGDRRGAWGANSASTTISILIEGRFILSLRDGEEEHEVCLERPGDYVIIAPGVMHNWQAPEAALVLTVRCPSLARDGVHMAE